ncbi:cadherin-like beta sandwich domain-containing protein [Paenibacillus roseipurpureus]|uniref:Carbohydrate-binding protein n=1 Tax=Paenibacillus roseopurpureus TaxID=2918901 RepID=A0AA96RJI0_9BACL|nr:cadherin-like beta sandwich domain-containing protein [Paenibacillus sp. MBLB1832]WNR45408.1 carbohydrate-binding protein [Paenibacillus sp. MBLB1832]
MFRKRMISQAVIFLMLISFLVGFMPSPVFADFAPKVVEAESFAKQNGIQIIGGNSIGYTDSNDWMRYDNVDLTGFTDLTIYANILKTNAKLDFLIDSVENGTSISGGTLIGSLAGVATADPNNSVTFASRTIQLNQLVSGSHRLYVRFGDTSNGITNGLANVDKFQFTRPSVSSNADLKQLTLSSGDLSPAFQSSVTSYSLIVYGNTTQVTLTPQVMDTGFATLAINGVNQTDNTPYPLDVSQPGSFTITVTAENGTTKTYTFAIQKQSLVPKVIQAEAFNSQYGTQTIASNTGVGYTDLNDWLRYDNVDLTGYTDVTLYANVLKTNAKIDFIIDAVENGTSISGGTLIGSLSGVTTADPNVADPYASRVIHLSQLVTGTHRLYVKFGSTSGSNLNGIANVDKYTFTRPQISANADLKQVTLSTGDLSPSFQSGITSYELSVYGNTSQVTITPQVMDTGFATLKINGVSTADNTPYLLNVNQTNSLSVTVTAESGAVKTYSFVVTRASFAPTTLEAEAYVSQNGIQTVNGSYVGYADSNDWIRYNNVDLTNYTDIDLYANIIKTNTRVDFLIDATESGTTLSGGTLIARLNGVAVADPNVGTSFALHTIRLNQGVSGTHTLYVRFGDVNNGSAFGLANVDKYKFKTISYVISDLQNIQLGSGATLSPAFSKDVYAYTAATAGLTEVDLTATLPFPDSATLKINGTTQVSGTARSISLIRGNNLVTIETLASDSTTKTYTVNIQNTGKVLRLEGESFQATGGASASTSGANQSGVVADLVNGAIGGTNNNDWARFDNVNLSPGFTDLTFRYATPSTGVSIEVWLDSTVESYGGVRTGVVGGTKLTTLTINGTETTTNYTTYKTKTLQLDPFTSGTHTLYLIFKGADFGVANVDWIEFNRNAYTNADLSNIVLDEKSVLRPAFDSNVTTYQLDIFNDAASFDLKPIVKDPLAASLSINGQTWTSGTVKTFDASTTNSVVFAIAGQEGGSKTYTLNINRRPLLMDVYVSPTGDDSQNGSIGSPFRTLAKAVQEVAPGRGATIHLTAGVFDVAAINLPQQTNLVGAGVDQTIIKASLIKAVTSYKQGDVTKYAIQGRNLHDASISGFTLDGLIGSTDYAHGGIFINTVSNFQIHDVKVQNFSYNGIWLENSVNSSIYNAEVYDTAFGNTAAVLGNLMFGNMTDGSIHDVKIRETRGTYGLKAARSDTFNEGGTQFIPDSLLTYLTRVKLYNLDIDLRQKGLWSVGQPNIDLEMPGAVTEDVEIYNSRFADSVSLISTQHKASKSIRVHHNQFIAEPAGANGYTYAIEVSMEKLEIDHNYFSNGYYPIASFAGKETGLYLHENIFDGIDGIRFIGYANGLENTTISNNVFRLTNSLQTSKVIFMYLGNNVSDNVTIEKNLFINDSPKAPESFVELGVKNGVVVASTGTNFIVKSNLFDNWTPYGTNAVSADPKLSYSDFRLAPDSPAYALGFHDINTESFGLPKDFFYAQPTQPIDRVYVSKTGEELVAPTLSGNTETTIALTINARTSGGTYKSIASNAVSYTAQDLTGNGVVSVNSQGVVTLLAQGLAKVTATYVDPISGTKTSSLYIQVTDLIAPTATVTYSTTEPTNQDVTATITPSEPVTITNNGGSNTYTFTENASFTFEFVDAAGNTGTVEATVANIGRIAPTATVAYSTTDPTNQDVTATITASQPITVTNNGGLTSHTFTDNGSFTFEFVDAAGNTGTAVATVANIDKVVPTATIAYSNTSPTNQSVTATITPSESVTLTNNGGSTSFVFSDNGSFTFVFVDAAGNTGTAIATVVNIDKVTPMATVVYSTTDPTNQDVTATITPTETVTITNNGGLASYVFTDNGSFTFTFVDAAGNAGTVVATVANIDKVPLTATVAYSTTSPTNQNVIATITPNKPVKVTNNGGSTSHTFTDNGSFTFTFVDAAGNTGSAVATVANIDKVAPVLTVILDPSVINQKNHKMVTVHASITANDSGTGIASVVLSSITSNEPDNGTDDGDTANDIQNAALNTNDTIFSLRAERSGSGNGRIYTIVYIATDYAGNSTTVTKTVTVPL